MAGNDMDLVEDQIVLGSQLSEMDRVPAWVDALALQYGIVERIKFAINLCLEEALSNVIRHGYANKEGGGVTVHFTEPTRGYFVFTVDDNAPFFNPLELPALPTIGQDATQIGGQGIRLLRGFADMLEYESTPTGNRLRIGFSNGTLTATS